MKTSQIVTITVFSLFLSIQAIGQEYELQVKESSLDWTGKAAFNAYKLSGNIGIKDGKIVLMKDVISNLEVLINMKSIEHEDKKLKTHLKGKDFFEVKTYPTAHFVLISSSKIKDGKAILIGNMTIKEMTKQEKISVFISKKKSGIEITFDTTLDRTAYGVEYNSPSIFEKLKADAIADEFSLKATLFFNN